MGRRKTKATLMKNHLLTAASVIMLAVFLVIPGNVDEPTENSTALVLLGQSERVVSIDNNQLAEGSSEDFEISIDPSRPMIALTFDDGPRASVTNRILKALREAGGRATFFMVGSNVPANEDSVNQMVAQGCQVGNHTFHHQYIDKIGVDGMQAEIGSTNQVVLDACGILPVVLRPPGGRTDEASMNTLGVMGMPAVLWSIDTEDWKHRDAQITIQTVLEQVEDGDIILMHDIYSATADAAEVLIPTLVEMGFQLVTVNELASFRGGMTPGKKYYQFCP